MASWVPLKAGETLDLQGIKGYKRQNDQNASWGFSNCQGQIPCKHFKTNAGSPECFQKLMELYEKGTVPPMAQPGPDGPRVLQMGFRDGTVAPPKFSDSTVWCTEIPYKKILTNKILADSESLLSFRI